MIRTICKDMFFLGLKADAATKDDLSIAADLLETLKANADCCVGMAANMIGCKKRIIAVSLGKDKYLVMLNPEIIKAAGKYETQEGCLSLDGQRTCTRFRKITVKYQDTLMRSKTQTFQDRTAQIIQHEIDHTNGILI